MNIIFSPSKEMNFEKISKISGKPSFYNKKTMEIIDKLKKIPLDHLEKITKISGKKLQNLKNSIENYNQLKEKPAIEAYSGLAFRQLDLDNYSIDEYSYISENIKILSALYGINNGNDYIKFHRLDMHMKIMETNFYEFWKKEIENTPLLNKKEVIINLASKEFSKLLEKNSFTLLNIDFLEKKEEKYKAISTNSKKARGLMLDYMIINKIYNTNDIKKFNKNGYKFNKDMSTDKNFVFFKD